MSFSEWSNKHKETWTQAPKSARPSDNSEDKEESKEQSFSEWSRDNLETTSLSGWGNSATKLFEEIERELSSDGILTTATSERMSRLLNQTKTFRSQYKFDSNALSYIDAMEKALTDARKFTLKSIGANKLSADFKGITESLDKYQSRIDKGEYLTKDDLDELSKLSQDYVTVGSKLFTEENGYDQTAINQFQRSHPSVASNAASIYDTYSQFDNAEDWKWAYDRDTAEKRLALNSQMEADLAAEKEAIKKIEESDKSWYEKAKLKLPHEAKIAEIETEMANYERGNYNENGLYYGSKTVDEYYHITQRDDFATTSANRDYKNPTREEIDKADVMNDSSTWRWDDATGTYRDAFGNELAVDGNNAYYNPVAQQTKVADKLALYFNTSEDDRFEAMDVHGRDGIWKSVMTEGYAGAWEYLTEGELGIYYTLLGESQEKAYQYLSDMDVELNRRRTLDKQGKWKTSYENSGWFGKTVMNIGTIPANVLGGASGFVEDAIDTLRGEEINPYSLSHGGIHYSNTVRGATAEDLDGIGWDWFDLGDVYQSGMSMADSLFAMGIGGGGTLLAMGAAEQEALRLYESGASKSQVLWGAATAGAAELVFESISLGNLEKIKNMSNPARGQLFKALLVQGGVEGSEEALTTIANTISNALIMGNQSDWAKLVSDNDGSVGKALLDKTLEVIHDGLAGAISGSASGAIVGAPVAMVQNAEYRRAGRPIKYADGGVTALKNLAMEKAGATSEIDSKVSEGLKKQADKISEKSSAKKVGMLYEATQKAGNIANASANQADIAKSLQRKGFSEETANDLASALVAQHNGQELTKAQEKLLKSAENSEVVKSAISNIMLNEKSTMGQRSQDIRDFVDDVKVGIAAKNYNTTKDVVKKVAAAQETGDAVSVSPTSYKVSKKGKTLDKKGNEIVIEGVESTENGKLILKTKDGTIDSGDVVYANDSDALVYEAVAKMGASPESAWAMIKSFNEADGVSALEFATSAPLAYLYGKLGHENGVFKNGKPRLNLNATQSATVYQMGRTDAAASVKPTTQASTESTITEKNAGKEIIYEGFKYDEKTANEVQRASIEAIEVINKMSSLEVHVFKSYKKNGKFYTVINGKERIAPNGYFKDGNKIYIDFNAGRDGRGAMLFTIAHEIGHYIAENNATDFKAISDFLFAHYGPEAPIYSELQKKKAIVRETYKRDGKAIPSEAQLEKEAQEELVCDMLSRMLADKYAYDKLMELKQENLNAFQKLGQAIKKVLDKLAKLIGIYDTQVTDFAMAASKENFGEEAFRQLQDLYIKAFVQADANFQAAQAKVSTDSIRGGADGAVVKSEVVTELIKPADGKILKSERTEFEALPKQVMSLSDGAGTILHSIEGLTPTKIKGISGKTINGYTGRDVRVYAMGISGFTKTQIQRVNKFMDTMSEFMQEAGVTYKFIGLQDVKDAKLHYTYNADGSIKSIVLSAMVKNGDYPVNFDLSSICKKRVAMSKLIDKLAKRGSLDNGTVKLTPANIFKINEALKDEGYETACLGCFVESKRYNSLEWAKKFCNKWNAAVKKVNPNATYFGYGDATFSEDSFTLEQAIKIDDAANKYITTTKVERMANALKQYKERERQGLPLVVRNYKGVEYHDFSKAAKKRLAESDTISDELKEKYMDCDTTTLNMADVEFLLENGILSGAALSNKQAVTEMVKSGEVYQHLLRPSDLLTDRGISKLEALPNFHGVLYGHYGSGTPKLMQSYTPYNSEIALLPSKKGDQSLAEYLHTIAGVRMQSFSDFQIQNIYDYLQMVADLAARKLPAHAYTKEISFAKLLGMTGIKVNLSVMFDIDPMADKAHAGLTKLNKLVHRGEYAKVVLEDAQGKWVYNIGDYQTQRLFAEAYPDEAKRFLQSIGFGDAVKLQSSPGYSANCGIIGVGYSDLGIIAMLNDNRIRYIIPYHASSLPAEIKLATNIALGTDYTPYQNNMKIKEIVDRNGNKVDWTVKEAYKRLRSGQAVINELNEKIRTEGWVVSTTKAQTGHGTYGLYENLQETNDPRQTASNFMDWCISNGTLPLFYQFASHENYYKLLYDFNVYDCVTEEYAPQQAVTNTYPTMVDGQVQPGTVTDGDFDAEYFKGTIDKQMAFMDEYSRNLDEDLDAMADELETGTMLSERDFTYKELTAKNPLQGRIIDKNRTVKLTSNGSIDKAWVVAEVLKQCESIQTKAPLPTYYVNIPDIGKNVEITSKPIEHGFIKYEAKNGNPVPPRSMINARASLDLPHILRNSIEVNRSDRGDNAQVEFSHVLIGVTAMESANGTIEYYAVRSVVESRKNQGAILTEANVIGKLHAMNAKKIGKPHAQAGGNNTALTSSSLFGYSVADLLNDVKNDFADTFSDDVYKHFGMTREYNERFSKYLLFSERDSDATNLESDLDALKQEQSDLEEQLDMASLNDLSDAETRKLRNRLYKVNAEIDKILAEERRATVKTSMQEILDNLSNYRRSDLESLAEQISEGAWDDVEDMSREDLEEALREVIQGRELSPIEMQNRKYGLWVRPASNQSNGTMTLHFQERTEDSVSNRSLLANAFEGVVKDDLERKKIQEYKDKIDQIDAQERKLDELNEQIKELSFGKGPRDTKKIRELRDEATKTANRITNLDKILLRLEASAPLQKVLAREKKKAYDRAVQKGRETLADYRESAAKSQMRTKIKNFKKKMETRLLRPTDRQFVPIDLINAMVEVCSIIDTDTDLYKADGSINKAQEQREKTKEKLQNLKDEYEKLKTHSDPIYAGEFDDMVYAYLTELRDKFKGKSLSEMSLDEMAEMYEILRGIDETLADARKLIGWGDAESVYEAGDSIVAEQREITKDRKNGKRNAYQKFRDSGNNLSLSPVRNVERMSDYHKDSYLLKLFKKFEQGIRKKNKFVMDAYKSFEKLTSGKEYEDAMYKETGKQYEDVNGRKFRLSKMQMMQAILSWERETANHKNHIASGGFSFADLDMLRKGKLKDAISEEYSHRVPAAVEMVADFQELLKNDKWCQDYMAAARKFFNETAKDAINETSIALKHRIIAKEKSYIPFEVDKNFVVREISAEDNIQQTINSYGMLKETKDGAPQPLIITGLNNILDRHIDQVGNVYGLAVEVRNFNKVWNVRAIDDTGSDPAVKTAIQRNWGVEGVKHIEQAVKDIQGQRVRDRSWFYDKLKSNNIGATFLLNLSVVTKQNGSLFSATSMIRWRSPARMLANLYWTMLNRKRISAEVDKYTATAWMRRQGMSDAELYTLMTEARKSGLGRLLSKAPAIVNPAKWITARDHAVALSLWRYCKIDTAKRTGLTGEELLKATAEFYDEVIENTQSMTDVLHRPEIQKSGKVLHEAFAMFKTDTFQMAGQLKVTAGRFMADKSGENAKALGKTLYSIAMSAMWGQLMTTLFALIRYKVKSYRDDEDEELTMESWLKRQGFGLTGDLMSYIFPVVGSEAVGIFQRIMYGESDDVADNIVITAVNGLADFMVTMGTAIKDGEWPELTEMRKYTSKVLQCFGIPANNILRTWDAIELHAKDIANGEFLSFEAGIDRSPKHHIHRIIEAMDEGKTDVAQGLFEEALEELATKKAEGGEYGEDELKEAKSDIKTALGKKYKDGEVSKETATKVMSNILEMDEDDIYWAFDKWDYAKENGSSDDYEQYGEFYTAVETGKNLKTVIKQYTDNGVSTDTLVSRITNHYKPKYIEMSKSERASIKGYLRNAMVCCGKTEDEANAKLQNWDLLADYPEYRVLSDSQAKKYHESVKSSGVSVSVYNEYCQAKEGYSKKDDILRVINSMTISNAQKDALYLSEGYAKSNLNEAPWH